MRRIETKADLREAVAGLLATDPRLKGVANVAGPLPLRRRNGGFEGLAAIITSQQISTAAAEAIWNRVKASVDPFTAENLLQAPEDALRSAGLSRPKIGTLTATATAVCHGFDLAGLHDAPADEAVASLGRLKGIGRWTAEVYLLFCVGHADVFPAGDLALQSAVHHGLGLDKRPDEKAMRVIADTWSPWRGVAAQMFWAYYRARRGPRKARCA